MRIGDIEVPAVQPTRTGIYLARAKDGSFTGVGPLVEKDGKKFLSLPNRSFQPVENFDCFGPLMFPAQADKLHTVYKIDSAFEWPKADDFGAHGRS